MTDIETLFQDHADDVYHFLVYYTRHRDVEDLVQETFIKALRSLERFEGRASGKTWLIAIARRVAIDESRKRIETPVEHKNMERQLTSDKPSPDASERVLAMETKDELMIRIYELPEKQRDVMLLLGISELDYTETAEVLGVNRASVYVTYHRAVKQLKKAWTDEGGMPHETRSDS